ncbi:tetratricopeptide repeat protein [Dyadobacter endophyticus]|uniref:tetratricopeptide repeat protein n=1 Tax=Dyadobacter endophyticus TaxID=1749036 RepID=UPI003CF89ED5
MRFVFTAIFICISCVSFAQKMSYEEWIKEAQENIRLLPKYGNRPKSKGQLAADDQLIEQYTRQEGSRSSASELLIRIGFEYLNKGEIRIAMYRFNQAWLLDPENENVFWGWGAIYLTFNDTSKALEQYDEGLSKNPENPNILTGKATIFLNRYYDNRDETFLSSAISLYSKSYSIDSVNQNTSYKLSIAHFLAKDCVNALKFYNICVDLGGVPIQKEYTEELLRTCNE